MKRLLFILSFCIACFVQGQAKNEIDVFLAELDKTIAERLFYVEKRESDIRKLKQELAYVTSLDEQYHIIGNIIDKYTSFICDSAETYIHKRLDIACKLNHKEYIQESKLQLSFVYSLSGLFTQAVEILSSLQYEELTNLYLRTLYCWNYIRYYENLIKYTENNKFSIAFTAEKSAYRDSLIAILPENSDLWCKENAFKLQEKGEYNKAYHILREIYLRQDPSTHGYAMESMGMARLYHLLDSGYQEKKHLILAAITDIKMAVKENEALLSLAMFLYEEGDINRAYNYVKVALDDANFYNSRFRNTVIARVQPIVENSFLYRIERQKERLYLFLILLVFFIIVLTVTLFLIYRQKKIVSKAKKIMKITNEQQIGLNKKLDEANIIKDVFIGYFMRQCAVYIEKMDDYRKLINRKLKARQMDELYSLTSSTYHTIDEAYDELHNIFDEAFLKLFPDFVEEVNLLLKEGDKYQIKKEKGLNTELRIMALMRLGIIDTNQIAVILHCSIQTIYNYKSKMKGKVIADQDTFEEKIKKIGRITYH